MINHIRKALLVLVLAIILALGYHLVGGFKSPVGKVKIDPIAKGVDIEIEDFRIVNEDAGDNDWELTADLAQVNYKKQITRLENVMLRMMQGENGEFHVSADLGILKNKARDIDLRGNVRLKGDPKLVLDRFKTLPIPTQ